MLSASFNNVNYIHYLKSKLTPSVEDAIISNWHRYLKKTVTEKPEHICHDEHILVGFGIVEDSIITLDQQELDSLVCAVIGDSEEKEEVLTQALNRAEMKQNKDFGDLEKEAVDEIDIIALILLLMDRPGLKPIVLNTDLQDFLINYFEGKKDIPNRSLGGASGNETYILRQLGLNILLHTPFHCYDKVKWKKLPGNVTLLIFDLKNAGGDSFARRLGFIFQFALSQEDENDIKKPALEFDGNKYQPTRSDRVIFKLPNYRKIDKVSWQKLCVKWKGCESIKWDANNIDWDPINKSWSIDIEKDVVQPCGAKAFESFSDYDWPWMPAFQYPPEFDIESGILTIQLATADDIKQYISDYKIQSVLLDGLQRLGDVLYTEALTEFVRKALIAQLKPLLSFPIHFELSGVASADILESLKKLFQEANIKHIGINREELVQITGQYKSPYFAWPRPTIDENAFAIYKRAEHFVKVFGCETLYVHDLELDILLLNGIPDEDGSSICEKHRQAMLLAKVGVPTALFRRADLHEGIDMVLSGPSLLTLISFSDEFAKMKSSLLPLDKQKKSFKDIFESFLLNGYYLDQKDEISVVVAPAVHVDLPDQVSLSGAGDMCFAVHSVLT